MNICYTSTAHTYYQNQMAGLTITRLPLRFYAPHTAMGFEAGFIEFSCALAANENSLAHISLLWCATPLGVLWFAVESKWMMLHGVCDGNSTFGQQREPAFSLRPQLEAFFSNCPRSAR
jgi:hypothetical protein